MDIRPAGQGIEKQEPRSSGRMGMLDEPVCIARMVGKDAYEGLAHIMIAQHQEDRNREMRQPLPQPFIRLPVPQIGKIARDNAEFGIGMPCGDVLEHL